MVSLLESMPEERVHYAVHFHRFDNRYCRYIRRHHLYHHGRGGRAEAFGLAEHYLRQRISLKVATGGRETDPSSALGRLICAPQCAFDPRPARFEADGPPIASRRLGGRLT